jgi:hypothetical protein
MARIRTIKPEFFTSEDIVELSPHARLLYIALWCEADREGRLSWKPRTFKMRYFPADDVVIDELCGEILARDLVVLYGDGLAYIPTFLEHQHVNPRETQSTFPDPKSHASSTRRARVSDAHPPVSDAQVGREGKEGSNDASIDALFEEFWSVYPKKASKQDALKAFKKLKPDEALHARMLAAVVAAKQSQEWLKDNGQFVPHAATWLNGRRWEDELFGQVVQARDRFAGAK